MCGILFSLTTAQQQVDPELWQTLTEINTKRGPDSQQTRTISVGDHFLQFYSTVLHLRGRDNVPQPVCENGNILCWNGEIFDGLSIALGENDTAALMQHLTRVDTKNSTAFLKVISRIEGPFAFVFWQEESKRLWFGRDCLGRRSLLWSRNENSLVISSAAQPNDKVEWQEVPANGIYSVQLGKEDEPETPVLLYPWLQQEENPRLALPFPRLNRGIPALGTETIDSNNELPPPDETMQTAVRDFTNVLDDAVKRRVADIPFIDSVHSRPRVAVLFSGGLDCICLAALAHRHLPVSEPIDLLNVAFENPRSQNAKQQKKASGDGGTTNTATATVYNTPDRVTGRASVEELRKIAPERTWHFVEINVPYSEAMTYREHIINLMHPLDTVMDLSIAMALWFASRGKGTIDIDGAYEPYESHARVLISGLGADEQLGGYSRHREAFRHGGWERLISEVCVVTVVSS
ncbi:asparagine synthase-domain-containing protein [Zychaea mexicana]|uniref:asparagine synthase-domain-containing protein n=1 Tax=Zychaea mexicana TaxID=64656 RepID=UPI0022FE57E0|nr:asparagine synthase-domain-containing protein [Zychaea mexicana]KAI9489014.1 asparagine synthase-domain-containing protein [Zychaea mexicana]